MSRPSYVSLSLLTLALATGCTDKGGDDTGGGSDSGGGTVSSVGLPQGQSTWTGTGEVGGFAFLLDVTLNNEGGDLSGSATVADDPDAPLGIGDGTYTLQGTHAPASGVFALAPVAWTEATDFEIELMGASGSYDPDAGTLTGQLRDWASASDNSQQGGPFTLTLVSGDGAQSQVGDQAKALASSQTFAGTMQCTGAARDVVGTLVYDGEGRVTGSMTVGDPGVDTPLGTFSFDGAHNPSTGAITILPTTWDEPAPSTLTFMVSGSWDPSTGAWTGDQLTNTAACPAGTWNTVITAG